MCKLCATVAERSTPSSRKRFLAAEIDAFVIATFSGDYELSSPKVRIADCYKDLAPRERPVGTVPEGRYEWIGQSQTSLNATGKPLVQITPYPTGRFAAFPQLASVLSPAP
jgi:hypothetical protein